MALTPSQVQAVDARGNVIVVAGAGTGKTSTLVERCVALLNENSSIENILMVTFTEAAAAEMRHRLRVRLAEAAAQAPPERADWWHEQLALLDTARICTLHSFCLQLLRENFHLLGIDPAVRILDDQQTRPLIEEALDACLEPHYEGTDEISVHVRELINRYGQGESERIRALVLKLHRYAQSLAAPTDWFDAQQVMFAETDPARWRGWLQAELPAWAEAWLPELERAGDAENLVRCARALRALVVGTSADAPALLEEICAADAADWPKKQKTILRRPFVKFFEEAEFLASQFAGGGLSADWENVRAPLRALLVLAQDFGTRLATAKRDLAGIDFADLEQFALQLLWDRGGNLTPVAAEWSARFEHVFVDECQDINAAQDAILRALSCGDEKHNRFLVGDVKQSIYQFRLARPALFRGYEAEWQDGESGQRIVLAENFRSVPGIIAFVNELFSPLMRNDVGGVEYEALKTGRADEISMPGLRDGTPQPEPHVTFCLIPKDDTEADDQSDGDEEAVESASEDLLATEREARLVALQLRAMRDAGVEVWDKEMKVRRPAQWRDMAVLLRSPKSRVEAFAQEFHKCGVPLQAARGGFFESTEISDLLSLLRLLDNPLQDIPLLAVLRSPLVAMTLDELAEVRAVSREQRFWEAVREFHRTVASRRGDESVGDSMRTAWEKLDWFLQRFAVWRELSRQVSLSQCLEKALQDSHYEPVIAAGDRGAERVANIRKFISTVRQYDPYQRQGLFRFLKFVDALDAAEQDMEPASVPAQDAVRLMSIHQSKGLEFPVVVVACLGGQFNVRDLSANLLLDEEFGVCAKAVDPESGARHPTLAFWLAARRQRRQMLGEELRLLYVAMTRARDHLLLIATATKKDADAWESEPSRAFSNPEILKARSALDWLMLWLPTVTRAEDWQDLPGASADGAPNEGGVGQLLTWRIYRGQIPLPGVVKQPPATARDTGVLAAEAVDQVKERIRWNYPHVLATSVTAKTTVTALRRKARELADEDAKPWVFSKETSARQSRLAPGIGAAEAGTLHHRFLQHMSLARACDTAGLRAELDKLTEQGVFSTAEAAELDIAALAEFWRGEVGGHILANREFIKRELPFTSRFTPQELERLTGEKVLPGLVDEFVVVQGVADLVVLRANEIWLIDFKTDRLREADLAAKIVAYRPQLNIYAAALEEIYAKPVTRRWLHFLALRKTVLV